MTGPGAAVSSDLDPSGMGIEVPMTFGPFELEPSASYAIFDAGIGGNAGITFTTSATGSSITPGATPPAPSNGSAASSGGAKAATTLGALALTVRANGKPMFTIAAKPVRTLKAGKYLLIVGDLSRKAGALIGHGTAPPSTLSGAAAVGTSSRTLKLTSGRWFVEASKRGPKIYFTVK